MWEDAHILDPEPLSIMGKWKKVSAILLRIQARSPACFELLATKFANLLVVMRLPQLSGLHVASRGQLELDNFASFFERLHYVFS